MNFANPSFFAPGSPSQTPQCPVYTPGVGDAPVGDIIGPRFFNADVVLRKTFELLEHYRLTLNFDAYNVLNHPNFGTPTLNVNTNVALQYEGIGSAGRARNISAGARLFF